MKIPKFLENIYPKVYIAVHILSENIEVKYVTIKRHKEIESATKVFPTTTLDDEDLKAHIHALSQISPYHYVATLDKSDDQGVIPTCSKVEAKNYIDESTSKLLCIDESYSLYTSQVALNKELKAFSEIGLDFLFSFVSVMFRVYHDKIANSACGAYVFLEEKTVALVVVKEGKVLFSNYIKSIDTKESLSLDNEAIEDEVDEELGFDLDLDDDDMGIDLEDMEANDIDDDLGDLGDVDDLGDIDDLDDLDDLDESEELDDFDDTKVEDEPEDNAAQTEKEVPQSSALDFQRFEILTDMLKKYYYDARYENDFVEKMYIAQTDTVGSDFKKYLEEELFVNVIIRKVSVVDELLALARYEVEHG